MHDLDHVLDTAERLVSEGGALSVRALAAAAGVSNGSIYHAFGSIGALLGRVWLRAAGDFLDLQAASADEADSPVETVVAAAAAPAVFARDRPHAARMLVTVRRDDLLGPALPDDLADRLLALDRRVVALLTRLARAMWGRGDGAAVEVLTIPPREGSGPCPPCTRRTRCSSSTSA